MTETEHVKLGAYHTVELEPQRPFTLEKQAWDAIDIERIRQSTDPALSADLAAVLITVSPFYTYNSVLKADYGQTLKHKAKQAPRFHVQLNFGLARLIQT